MQCWHVNLKKIGWKIFEVKMDKIVCNVFINSEVVS